MRALGSKKEFLYKFKPYVQDASTMFLACSLYRADRNREENLPLVKHLITTLLSQDLPHTTHAYMV